MPELADPPRPQGLWIAQLFYKGEIYRSKSCPSMMAASYAADLLIYRAHTLKKGGAADGSTTPANTNHPLNDGVDKVLDTMTLDQV
jgi:hypothetical protein